MKEFIKHTIECNCVLPQYKNIVPIVFHKFIVFSIINEDEIGRASCRERVSSPV